MRITIVSLMLATVCVSGCNRSDAATTGSALAAPAATNGEGSATPVGTVGHVDSPRAPEAVAAATPVVREVTIPAGTLLTVALDTAVGSDISRVEQPVTAHLTRPVHVHSAVVLAQGSRLSGVVTDATRSAKVKGRAHLAIRFDSLTPSGDDQRYAIRTMSVARTAQGTKQKDALKIGAPAAGGAIIGALLGGKKGALVGTAVGGGAGTAVVLSTRGKEVHLAKGAPLTLKLSAPLTVRVRG
ncbi:MAG: hypothetical protein JWL71_41 [Acidobacteria bacterium]|nr:hypothetical protein [Acidobacteriota bacterium]